MRLTVPSAELTTQTSPSPPAIPRGSEPTRISSPTVSFVSGSIWETVPSPWNWPWLATQMNPLSELTCAGWSPTGIVASIPKPASVMRETVSSMELLTQTDSSLIVIPRGCAPTSIGSPTTCPDFADRRETLPSPEFATQTTSSPTVILRSPIS